MRNLSTSLLASFIFLGLQTTGSLSRASESNCDNLQMNLPIDPQGLPKATIAAPCELYGGFLESDIQGSPKICTDLLTKINQVKKGTGKGFEEIGNAFSLVVNQSSVNLSELNSEKVAPTISLAKMSDILTRWCAFIQMP